LYRPGPRFVHSPTVPAFCRAQ